MDDMNDTHDTTGQPTGAAPQPGDPGPRLGSEQIRELHQLRRSTNDRYIAGVAGGLGRHFGIDPTIIRVVLVVLAFFGLAGVVIYVAAWLFVPEDGQQRARIELGHEGRKAMLIGAVVVAGLLFLGDSLGNLGGNGFFWPLPLIIIGLVVFAVVAGRNNRRQPPAPWGGPIGTHPANAVAPGGSGTPVGTPVGDTSSAAGNAGNDPGFDQTRPLPWSEGGAAPTYGPTYTATSVAPPAWMPPAAPAYVPPPRPRRTGMVLFWPTLALIAIALGSMAAFGLSVPVAAYPAVALAITGAMLVLGAFVGRGGGLIALGLFTSVALALTSIVGVTVGDSGNKQLHLQPLTAAEVTSVRHAGTGTIDLDLTKVADPANLDGRTIDLSLRAGEIRVTTPPGVTVELAARIRYAGDLTVGPDNSSGINPQMHQQLNAAPGQPTLRLNIDLRVGSVEVNNASSVPTTSEELP